MNETRVTRRTILECAASVGCASVIGGKAMAREPETKPATPVVDVGSLLPFIDSQALHGKAGLSYLQERFADLGAWKKEARAKFVELLHYSPAKMEPRADVIARVDRGDYWLETVQFNTTADVRVPAFVLVPKRGKVPAPAIIALHDHGGFYLWGKEKLVEHEKENASIAGFKRKLYGGKSIASELARQGYVVIVIDMFYWGDRRMLQADDPADWRERPREISEERVAAFNDRAWQSEDLVGRTILSAGFTWAGVMIWDDVRTVDYLVSRPEVDAARIGCLGLSVGGVRSCYLAAMDDRIKAAVIVGWMTSFPTQLKDGVFFTIGHTKLVPGLYRHLDYPDVAAMGMPAAMLVMNGKKDKLFSAEGVKRGYEILAQSYAKAGMAEKLRTRTYDTTHEFNLEMQAEAWEWLRKWV